MKVSKFLGLSFIAIMSVIAAATFSGDKVYAAGEATTQLPADSTFMVVSAQPAVPGNFHNPVSTNYFYVPSASTSANVQINNISNGSITLFSVGWLDGGGGCNYTIASIVSPSNGQTVTINATSWPAVTIADLGAVPYKIFCVSVATFDLNIVNYKLYSSADTRLGVYAGPFASQGTSYFRNNGAKWQSIISFAPPCNVTGAVGGNNILLYDLDNGYSQVPNIDIHLTRYNRQTNAYISSVSLSGDVDYAYSGFGVDAFRTRGGNFAPWNNNYTWNVFPTDGTYYSDSRYELVVGNAPGTIGQNNKIRIRIPFDQIYSTFRCDPPPDECPNIAGNQPIGWAAANGYIISGGNCVIPNTAPSGNFSITCDSAAVLTVTANVSDTEGGTLTATANVNNGASPASRTGTRTNSGAITFATFQGAYNTTHTVTGTVSDPGGLSATITQATATCPPPPNTAPSGSFGITCDPNTFVLTVTAYNVNDAEDNGVQVFAWVGNGASLVNPPGAGGFYQYSEGTFVMGTTQGVPGQFYDVSGTIRDSAGAELYQPWTSANVTCPRGFTWITGAVRNAYDPDIGYAGETIETCVPGVSATTDANGNFAFQVREGEGFCVRVTSNVAGAVGAQTRPRAIGYRGCGPFGLPSLGVQNALPNYCPSTTPYENQVATDNPANGWDRATNDYYDYALRFKPQISCVVTSPKIIQTGAYRPTFRITNTGNSGRPTVTSYNVFVNIYKLPFNGTRVDNKFVTVFGTQVLAPGNSTNPDLIANETWGIVTTGQYEIGAVAGASGDSLPADTVQCISPLLAGNKSYLKTYGGETWAGGSFPTTAAGSGYTAGQCTTPDNGRIYTYAATEYVGGTTYRGSSSQFAVAAFLGITDTGNDAGYYSASARPYGTVNTWPAKGLTFANTGGGTYGSPSGMAQCMVDFYGKTVNFSIPAQTTIPASFSTGMQRIMLSGDQTIGSLTINNNQQVAIYVDGDVYLNGNITFGGARTTAEQLPYFALIVRGNIYIDNDVTRLDGVYVAQPTQFIPDLTVTGVDTVTKGTIYTCVQGSNVLYTNATIYANCSNQLVVNGSLIAQNVKFLRTFGTLKDGSAGELPSFATGSGTQAAEVINYSPEQYLAPSPLKNPADGTGDSSQDNYSSISTLPPLY